MLARNRQRTENRKRRVGESKLTKVRIFKVINLSILAVLLGGCRKSTATDAELDPVTEGYEVRSLMRQGFLRELTT